MKFTLFTVILLHTLSAHSINSYFDLIKSSGQLKQIELLRIFTSNEVIVEELHSLIKKQSLIDSELKIVPGSEASSLSGVNWIILGEKLVKSLSKDELLFLIAHESAHLYYEDPIKRFNMIKQIKDIASPEDYIKSLEEYQYLIFPQIWGQELDADKLGIKWAIQAGADPVKAIKIFTKIESNLEHPSSLRRMRVLLEELKASGEIK